MEDQKQWAWKLANCTLKDILLTKTMDEVFIWFKTLWKGHWLNEKYTLQSFMISVATSNFESKCLVLNAHVRVSLLGISSKLLFVQMYRLCTVMRAYHNSAFVSSWISFVFGYGLSASVGNLLKFFSCYCEKWLMQVINRAGKQPEITVALHVTNTGKLQLNMNFWLSFVEEETNKLLRRSNMFPFSISTLAIMQ